MKLTKTQMAWLVKSYRYKDSCPSFWRTFWSMKNAWLIAIPIGALGIWNFLAGEHILACIMISIAWGNIFASMALSFRSVAIGAAFREVTNWERVEELIRENGSAVNLKP